ncbi:MAG: LacI family DNA-binding transcriptional regulator [Phycisphaerales bacterium]
MKRSSRPGIKDVAAAAGVSPTTVSDALNGKGRLPDETRERVRQVAEKLGYRPNAIARGLRNRQVGLLGLILIPAPATSVTGVSYWIKVLTQAAESALERGYALVMLPSDPDALTPMTFPVDGVIVVDPAEGDVVLGALRSEAIPFVTIGRDLAGSPEPSLDDAIVAGVESLLNAIAQPGERVALLTMASRKSYIQDAVDGTLAWKGHPAGYPMIIEVASPVIEDVQPAVADLIASGLPDVLLGVNERVTMSALRALRAAGVSVPRNIRLASLVEAPELIRVKPTVTALVQHPKRSAELAVATIIDVIEGRKSRAVTLTPLGLRFGATAPKVRAASPRPRARKSAR